MSLLLEKITFAQDECLRLLRWQGNAQTLHSLEANGKTVHVKGIGGRWHSHEEMELTLFTRGSGIRYIGDHTSAFHHLECVMLGSHLPHCWVESGDTDGYVLQFHIPIAHPLGLIGGGDELRNLFNQAEFGLKFSSITAQKMKVIVERIASSNKLARAGLLLELLALASSTLNITTESLSQTRFGSIIDADKRSKLETVVQWIIEEFTCPLSLEGALQRSAMSRATFSRQFQQHTGKTFTAFVTSVRLTHAHQLLIQNKYTISEIAYECGFGSLTRFNATFQKRFAMTPSETRQKFLIQS